jgi:nucleoside-diphosphate-sugar epimerase
MYGVTKVSGELLCDYYAARFGVDTRGLHLPGLISHVGRETARALHCLSRALRSVRGLAAPIYISEITAAHLDLDQ